MPVWFYILLRLAMLKTLVRKMFIINMCIAVTDLENNWKSCQEKALTFSLGQAALKLSAELKEQNISSYVYFFTLLWERVEHNGVSLA